MDAAHETVTDLAAGADAHEARLLQRAANGDHDAAMGELYDRYGRRLYGYGLRALSDPGLAEDLVQETFVRLWRAAGRFDAGRGTVRAYLFTIARNAAIDLHRRRPKHERAELGDPPAEGNAFEALVTRLAVRDAVEALPDDFREVLELSYDQELSHAQIAERLEMPVGTVKSRTFYAMRALKTQLTLRGVHG